MKNWTSGRVWNARTVPAARAELSPLCSTRRRPSARSGVRELVEQQVAVEADDDRPCAWRQREQVVEHGLALRARGVLVDGRSDLAQPLLQLPACLDVARRAGPRAVSATSSAPSGLAVKPVAVLGVVQRDLDLLEPPGRQPRHVVLVGAYQARSPSADGAGRRGSSVATFCTTRPSSVTIARLAVLGVLLVVRVDELVAVGPVVAGRGS